MTVNSVVFRSSDSLLQRIYDEAERKAKGNITDFAGTRVLVEGGEYRNVWLETQPMGGAMYAKRDYGTGLSNVKIFMDSLGPRGMMPGMITCADGVITPRYDFIQGFCFPSPALELYYIGDPGEGYLTQLAHVLESCDRWFHAHRESDGDGCLETWCPCDTGEDYSSRFFGAPHFWDSDEPPRDNAYGFPHESMDMMAYSYDARATLARISAITGDGRESEWLEKAEQIKYALRERLWRPEKSACYDRDGNNQFLETLCHNNLRCMYHGVFTQDMADGFIRCHMLNPDEFWTKAPLPSIAVNDPLFRNIASNDWSGQPEGLTYQRAIQALENYGHCAEIPLIAERLFASVGYKCVFTQQFDPFTGAPSEKGQSGDYGPTLLACLEYISRLYGVHRRFGTLYWGAYKNPAHRGEYVQKYGSREYKMVSDGAFGTAYVDGREAFRVSSGFRIETDCDGVVTRAVNIMPYASAMCLKLPDCRIVLTLRPNDAVVFNGNNRRSDESVPFDYQ